ncbi:MULTISPECIES: discoidin domain-containing protein [unclassified Streptomyces]|uniref:galactose-binding domain-containing protein n=1 Tax=unclassified Streptomyces TaxID=2593676 RepID=UPI00224E2479|nr:MULTISPECIES: discoidin domain-containing protein [unclassified Streptomyces]MCX5337234.1 discoidin domain-containing protein [Streptomyces sp. NBC_00140]MCX5365815.1 discoidin domain-containing protein [Streptomyces sp. NBC_00124]
MTRCSYRRRKDVTVVSLLLFVLAIALGPTPSSAAASDWWNPSARPTPDSQINVTGEPFTGTNSAGEVRGFVDAHNHLFSNEAFGGRLICGKVFSTAGVADALKDCPEHYPDGTLAIFDYITHGGDGKHDPVGWPTFKDWPAYDSMTHQANYYAWIERAWRGGQRVLVNDLVTNGMICSVYPFKDRSCDEMTSIRLQAKLTYQLQDYVDAMYGGAGKGWFRIVTDTAQARQVIQQGKLAVILGVETSEPFGCKQILDIAQCSKADIDKGLDELYDLGVRSMFLCHKFDNALCGVRFDEGGLGTAINVGQFLSTGTFWKTEKCTGPQHDNPIGTAASEAEADLPAGTDVPEYDENAQCNVRGLTDLGEYAVQGMMKRKMMLEIDHMSVKATGQVLDMFEAASYPGVLSSHSWMDLNWTERVYSLGGFVAQYMHGSEGFSTEAKRTDALRAKYNVGYGYGTDFNGIGDHPAPRGADATNKVTYPFKSVDGGSVIDKQTVGSRTFDFNTDGGANVGLIPDWVEDIRHVGGQDVVDDLFRGAESYLDTWGASEQHQAGVNLAKGRTATASSSESNPFTSYQPGRAVDGDGDSRWASDWSDDQWWQVDLGSTNLVSRVTLDWERAYGKSYRVELSTDGTNWQTAWSTTSGDGGLDTAKFTGTPARYVRVHGLDRGTDWGYSLHEVGVNSA